MKNTDKCNECGAWQGEHKVWCSLDPTPQGPVTVTERVWTALTSDGRRLKFTVGPKADAEFALAYARRNSHKLQFEQLAFSTEIVSVEAGEESTRVA
jgi:hypothetical protein